MAEDRMLSDEVLLALIKKNSGGGGGGGTDDYNDLKNQPQIGGNTLVGNKTASDLGLVAAETGKGLSSNDYTNEDKAIVGGVTAALADKADKSAVKNEFIGTLDEWNALTVEQRKAYDTYQIKGDFIGGGGTVKEMRYTGTGTVPNTIDFGNDTPKRIMCIIPDPDEEFVLPNYEAIGEIAWAMMLALSYWSTQSGGVPTTSNGGTNLIRMSFSGNTVTLNAQNAAQIANASGQKYLVKYEV